MGTNDRLFEPPAVDLAKINARLARLPPLLADLIHKAGSALALNDAGAAQRLLARALSMASGQPDVLRLYGLLLAHLGNLPAAVSNFEAAIRAAPDDAMGWWQYAQVCEQAGDVAGALRLREQAVRVIPESPLAWSDLGEHLSRHHEPERALPALERAVRLAPDYAPAQLKLGDTLVADGHIQEGAAAVRKAIASEPAFGAAWLSLADIKTVQVVDDEVEQMRALLQRGGLDAGEYTAVEFALAQVCEQRGEYRDAFELLLDANARRKREIGAWEAEPFRNRMQQSGQVFAAPHATAEDPALGREVVFVLGLPRSGTTLVEQILASHPDVQGAGELSELAQVLTGESASRKLRYPAWIPAASAADWRRLGHRYLELTRSHRGGCAKFTDKMPNNWQALGAIRAMLPGARIVICRRDPLENCWSCYRQYFPRGWAFTSDFDELGIFWRAFDHVASSWSARDPDRVREQGYEVLTENPEQQVRELLAFCGLPFDPACLKSHGSRRRVQTLSAGQVRQPMRRHMPIAPAYGAMLDPLRRALGLMPGASTPGLDCMGNDA